MKIMPSTNKRVIWVILDGVGVGALPDASEYDDEGANTLGNLADTLGGLSLPNMEALGLGNLTNIIGVAPYSVTRGAYGKMTELSPGKDSTTGHWELAGVILDRPFPVYPKGFPAEVRERFEELIGIGVLGNKPASGTVIIEELGEEHMKTGKPILYTSVDSVFQMAAHKEVIPLNELYRMCEVAREMLRGEHMVSRVIARPFIGSPGGFERIGAERMDLSLPPPRPTVLDLCREAGMPVKGVGKVGDLYAGRGFESSPHTSGNLETMRRILQEADRGGEGILMANLVDFDMLYGHRRDCLGFARGLKEFDDFLPELKKALKNGDICVVVSDHGCDPTYRGSDHTREYAILLVFGKGVAPGIDLGVRESFADCGKSIAELLEIKAPELDGTSFAAEVLLPV